MSFEDHLKHVVADLRNIFTEYNENHLHFKIEVDGCVHNELLITFKLGNYGNEVSGNSIKAVTQEYFRRRGWQRQNTPLCLPNAVPSSAPVELEDDIPF